MGQGVEAARKIILKDSDSILILQDTKFIMNKNVEKEPFSDCVQVPCITNIYEGTIGSTQFYRWIG